MISYAGDMFDKDETEKATTADMYAALDLGQRTIRAVSKSQDMGEIKF